MSRIIEFNARIRCARCLLNRLLLLVLLGMPGLSLAGLCHVNHAASGANDGSSWADAYVDLQDALGNLDCDKIWVAAGTYLPTDGGDTSISFVVRDSLALYGGFNGSESERDDRDWINNETILSGDIDNQRGERTNCVVEASDTGDGTVIDGLIVERGGEGCSGQRGAGIHAANSSLVLRNSIVRNSGRVQLGPNSVAMVETGGGIYVSNGSPMIDSVLFKNNEALVLGGGMHLSDASATISDSAFVANGAGEFGGGGLSLDGSAIVVLINVTLSSNSAGPNEGGGGILHWGDGLLELTNVTFSGNWAGSIGDSISVYGSGSIQLNNVLMDDGESSACFLGAGASLHADSTHNLIEDPDHTCGLVDGQDGNLIGVDPMLGPLADNGGFTPTHALLPDSPAIGAGSNAHCPETDQRGIPRPQGVNCDIGAYESVLIFEDGFEVILQPGDTFTDCDECPTMVLIPAGTFTQGSPASEPQSYGNERPQRSVNVPAFAMGQTAVTFAEWDACVADGGCTHNPGDQGWGRGNRPVINVSWNDAQQYVTWLSNKTGHTYRLPSESEWEYATRAGTTGRFNTGDCITTDQADFWGTSPATGCPTGIVRNQTLPVASFAPNAFGLYDTHGNTWEWVQDCWNENYVGAPTDGSAWMSGDCSRAVLRGGSWYFVGSRLRSALRVRTTRGYRYSGLGFRVARSVNL